MKKFEAWAIAFRKKNKSILDDTETPFKMITNSWRYWRADPFVFDFNDKTYLFAELYDRILRRGVIGCVELSEYGCGKWHIALKEPFHLSYPNVFEHDGNIYMIPESYVANEIRLYKAAEFPYKWEYISSLSNVCAVDSTLIEDNGEQYLMTQIIDEKTEKLAVFKADKKLRLSDMFVVSGIQKENFRPAGKAFCNNSELFRPSQDCTESYGSALNIAKITKLSDHEFEEHIIKKIYPNQIHTDTDQKYYGIHTYNFSDRFEVIDLKSYETDLFYPFMRVFWAVVRRFKKLAGKL